MKHYVFLSIWLATSLIFVAGCSKKRVPPALPAEEARTGLSISRVVPNDGRTDTETPITITGSGYEPGATVTLGEWTALDVRVEDSGHILAVVPTGLPAQVHDLMVRNPSGKQAVLRSAFSVRAVEKPGASGHCELRTVYFGYDDESLSDEARKALRANFDCLKALGATKIQVEGHADERGSTDYNLALGQRRAEAAMHFLRQLGVRGIETISFGEERPAAQGHDEDAWRQNRRAEILILNSRVSQN